MSSCDAIDLLIACRLADFSNRRYVFYAIGNALFVRRNSRANTSLVEFEPRRSIVVLALGRRTVLFSCLFAGFPVLSVPMPTCIVQPRSRDLTVGPFRGAILPLYICRACIGYIIIMWLPPCKI